jgi:opacity protein-like surface antigen
MTNMRRLILLLAAVAAAAAFGAAQASASSAPIVIPYAKTCDATVGHCVGTAGDSGTLEMQVTSFRATGEAAQLTFIESVTVGDISFTAEMIGHASPAGFIVLNGTVTEGSFAGAQVHQRSNLVSAAGTTTSWTGELQLMPPSA